jgi:predicted CxxxxCH...CXXCH cytochrome family protein
MKKLCRMEHVTRLIVATLLSLSMVMLLTNVAHALDCTRCHGSAGISAHPVDTPAGSPAAYRNITTGAVKGNHGTHSVASTTGNVCTKCHGDAAASYRSNHALTGKFNIQMASKVRYNKYTSAFGVYTSALTSFPQTSDPKLGKCSTVDCHFQTRTPVWGSAPLGAAGVDTCSVCHNALPATGSHAVHIAEHGNDLNTCVLCHTDHAAEARPFQHATSAGRAIAIHSFRGYSGNGSNNHYLPSQQADRTLGYCSTASCHDDGLGNGAASLVESPVWGSTVAKCDVCHPSRPITGSHTAHLVRASCAACHKGAVESSTVPEQHSDGNIDVYKTTAGDLGYPANKDKGSVYTTCATATCHVDPSSNGLQKESPAWGDSTQTKCSYCHASRPATGSHQSHYDAGFATCANCHNGAVEGATLSTSHDNNLVDVYKTVPGDFGYPSPKAIGSAPGKCSTGSCHEDGRGNAVASPTWGTTVPNCSACHATIPDTGSHLQHITGVGVTCGNCHKGAVQGSTVPALHLNNVVDVYKDVPGDFGGGYPAAGKVKGSDFASCTTVNCHGRLSPTWGANTGNYQCTKCHGAGVALANFSTATFQQAAPGYNGVGLGVGRQSGIVTRNVSNDPKVGAHDTHMRSLNNLGKPVSCSDCHVVPATAFISGHMNGDATPTWSNLVQNKETIPGSARPYTYQSGAIVPGYNPADGTCSNTYCHGGTMAGGNDKSPKWNDSTYLTGDRAHDCSQCHGFPPVNSARKAHNPATDMQCDSCHPHNGGRPGTGVTSDGAAVGYDYHINGNLEASGYCNSCHDYDTRGTSGALWGKNPISDESFGAHAMHINYLKKRMNVTNMDANVDVFGSANYDGICGVCHSREIADHTQSNRTTSTRNINFGGVLDRQFGPDAPHYNGQTGVSSAVSPKTCSNIDCHFKTSPIWQPF